MSITPVLPDKKRQVNVFTWVNSQRKSTVMPSQAELFEREFRRPLFPDPNARDWRYPPSRMRGLKKQRKLTWDEVKLRFDVKIQHC